MIAPAKIPVILQQASSDCGVACLASVIRYFGGERSIEYLRHLSGTAIQGTTVLGLVEAARQLGMEGDAFRVKQMSYLDELEFPVILHVVIDQKLSHFVVCYGKKGEQYQLMDPALGARWLTEEELLEIWQSRTLVLIRPGSEFETSESSRQKKREWILDLIRPDLPILLISGFLGLVTTILGLAVAVFSQKLIDEFLPNQAWQKLSLGLVLLFVLLIGRSVLSYLRAAILVQQSKELNLRLISGFFEQLLGLPKVFFDSRKVGDITSRMNDSRRIQRAVSVLTTELMVDSFVVIVCTVSIFLYSWEIGCWVAVFLPVYFLLVYRYHSPIQKGQKAVMISYSGSESGFIDTLTGIGAVKGESKEGLFLKVNQRSYHRFQDDAFALGQVSNRLGLVSQLAGVVFLVSVLGICCYLVAQNQLELGVLVAISGMLGMLVPAVNKLALANLQIQEAKIAGDRLYEFVQLKKEQVEEGAEIPETVTRIQVENLRFRFPGRKLLFDGLSFELKKGKLSVLLGESGGGKSTLLQVLMGFYPPESGSVLINGDRSLQDISKNGWRERVGYVPQEIKIFNGSLGYNLSLDPNPTGFEQVVRRCQELGLHEFFERMPQGYFTQLGEEGVNLSGGQKQLVGIARALIKRPKVLLLDEFTGAMDRMTEQKMLDLILKVKKEIPVLVVTHRIRPALLADEVMILDQGKLVEVGTPDLLAQGDNLLSGSLRDLVSG
ncbi:MAG: peptidase domain-containing ABC transporter [Cyclobacteriaceae bacterium]|nr:peptidase domain-containing ABC transporter [Cyclobacteriaceae bacterium]MDX5467540.1 peptidase domain-containing ABC transporter [Cyclobacteriaceae bacterium]